MQSIFYAETKLSLLKHTSFQKTAMTSYHRLREIQSLGRGWPTGLAWLALPPLPTALSPVPPCTTRWLPAFCNPPSRPQGLCTCTFPRHPRDLSQFTLSLLWCTTGGRPPTTSSCRISPNSLYTHSCTLTTFAHSHTHAYSHTHVHSDFHALTLGHLHAHTCIHTECWHATLFLV